MRWELTACVLATGLLVGCASVASHPTVNEADAREQRRMARNLEPGERDRIADELRAAELRYASGDTDGAVGTVIEIHDATGDPRAAEVLGKFALSEGRFGAAERHFEDARQVARSDRQKERLEDLLRLAGGFRAYERGALAEAQQRWAAIRDPDVRSALARARATPPNERSGVAQGGAR